MDLRIGTCEGDDSVCENAEQDLSVEIIESQVSKARHGAPS